MIDGTQNYNELKAAYGESELKRIENRMLELQANGYEKSTKITDPAKLAANEQSLRKDYDTLIE